MIFSADSACLHQGLATLMTTLQSHLSISVRVRNLSKRIYDALATNGCKVDFLQIVEFFTCLD